jgi:hypothetical protein
VNELQARPLIVLLIGSFFPLFFWLLLDIQTQLAANASFAAGHVVLALRAVQIGSGSCVTILLAFKTRKGLRQVLGPLRTGFQLRLWLYCVTAGALVPTVITATGQMPAASPFAWSTLWSCALIGWAIWIAVVLAIPSLAAMASRGPLHLIEITLFNLIILLLLSELSITGVQRFLPSPVLWDDSSAATMVDNLRGLDDAEFMRFNSRGFPDKEFFEVGPHDYTVAVVTDSFGVGSVPYQYNFATVAERRLQESLGSRYKRVAVDNYGIIIINMPEYLHLLSTEVLPANPDQIVLAVFVGNDIGGLRPDRARDRSRLQNWLVVQTVGRLRAALSGVEYLDLRWKRDVETAGDPPFVHDSSLETPSFTEDAFLRIERDRLEVCNTKSDATTQHFTEFFEALGVAADWVGSKLLVMIIPDEFQVNDRLYEKLMASHEDPTKFDRDYPQNQIVEWGRSRGIRVLDLLPVLRKAEPEGRTYHVRDTHWNARGNRIVGEVLAEELLAR